MAVASGGSVGGGPAHPPRGAVRAALSRSQAEDAAMVLRVVSDATRLQILSLIMADSSGRVRVTELTAALGLRQPTVSHHLKVLTDSGVLEREPVGRDVWYHVVPSRLDAIADLLR
ncbi:ArsR/SmtB family transcription factor [Gordonia sp. NPDC003422]